jgi:UPF0716 protein FxsA
MRWFFLLLPWIELFTLIQLGSRIGAFQTLLYVFATLLLGLTIMRAQGMEIIGKLREVQMGGVLPQRLLVDELAVGLGGLLLIIPGLVTDSMAVLVLLGPLWRRLMAALGGPRGSSAGRPNGSRPGDPFSSQSSHSSRSSQQNRRPDGNDDPIEGEFRRLDDD